MSGECDRCGQHCVDCVCVKKDSVITMYADTGKWFIKISKDGFKFNHDDYPHALVDDFARAFVELLEKEFVVTMEKSNDHLRP